jgi:4-diphosphocytidyl-2C-methyl-D-erythritol kinase
MRETAYAKLNLALHVRGRMADGYHRLETVFAFAEDGDRLDVSESDDLLLEVTGEFGELLAVEEDNLVLRAARALRNRYRVSRGAYLVLDKRLPVAAGVGGGSADAAAALRLLVRWWDLRVTHDDLLGIAAGLGADVPACLLSLPSLGRGRGDELVPVVDSGLPGTPVLLVNPRVALSTAEVFRRWEGPLPRLAYVADSGSNENGYYERILRRMVHPRTGKPLSWQRVVDYYHVSERVWVMATALFGNGTREGNAWAHRMLKALKQPSGASRVLHSAASLYHRRQPPNARSADFWKAYRYIQQRTQYLRYSEYASHHIPLGSGVTEAACKTIFTQRLKLSGMRWSFAGAQTILSLRVILLSGTWSSTYAAHLVALHPRDLRPYAANRDIHLENAA